MRGFIAEVFLCIGVMPGMFWYYYHPSALALGLSLIPVVIFLIADYILLTTINDDLNAKSLRRESRFSMPFGLFCSLILIPIFSKAVAVPAGTQTLLQFSMFAACLGGAIIGKIETIRFLSRVKKSASLDN